MTLQVFWFCLITLLFMGFFLLEGFDYGVGILLPFVAWRDKSRRVVLNSIGGVWDGNEVWMVAAGGAIFAAFPTWYASMFSGFYLALFMILLSLMLRGVCFEFRDKSLYRTWRRFWDLCMFAGSVMAAFLWGIFMGNMVRGVPLDANFVYAGSIWDLLNPFSLVSGLMFVFLFAFHGSLYLCLRTEDILLHDIKKAARSTFSWAFLFILVYFIYSFFEVERLAFFIMTQTVLLFMILARVCVANNKFRLAFTLSSLSVLLLTSSVFVSLFPCVLRSNLNNDWSLTIYNASSSPYSMKVMTIVALIFLPIILIYQGFAYWVFRHRVTEDTLNY